MSVLTRKISLNMSLRTPQEEALTCLDKITSNCDYQNDDMEYIEKIASENSQYMKKIQFKFAFPSFCYEMTTGIGKTRLMGAMIYYLYKTKGYKHFFILTPGNTIYDKLRMEALPDSKKYFFNGLQNDLGTPKVYDGENYTRYKFVTDTDALNESSEIEIFVFNIGKIYKSGDTEFHFHKYQESLGSSFADVLAKFDDLVICMDEAHRYYAPASMKAINALKPVLGLEFTATAKDICKSIVYQYGLNEGAGKFLKIPVVLGRTNMSGYSAEDIETMKIVDGITLHENRKKSIARYCSDNNLPLVKPIVLIACKDTNHAKVIREKIESNDFFDGKYIHRVMEVTSKVSGDESEENIKKLLSIESTSNPIEIVIHVYKLKEGWDVNNLYTIIPLNAAKSDILALQTIGRGLRLPFGKIVGDEEIDTLDIVAHDHYRELLDDIKNNKVFQTRNLDDEPTESLKQVTITSLFDDDEMEFIESTVQNKKVNLNNLDDVATQQALYDEYQKTFAPKKEKKHDDVSIPNLFNLDDNYDSSKKEDESSNPEIKVETSTKKFNGQTRKKEPLDKDTFLKKAKKLNESIISTPLIHVTPTSKNTLVYFDVKRNIVDFEVTSAKIERYDAINKELLSSLDAVVLKDEDPVNTIACLLLQSVPELSSDDADFIWNLAVSYLDLIDGTDDDKKIIIRRYSKIIVDDIKKQIYEHMKVDNSYVYSIQKSTIFFKASVRNVKSSNGILKYTNPFTDKKNIRKYIFDGYRKSYYSQNSFDSDSERLFSIILEEDPDVIKWIRLPQNQLGLFWKIGQQYNPDFLVETRDAKYMIEVKGSNEEDNPEVLSKAQQAIKWCEYASQCDIDGKTWNYRIITDNNIIIKNTFKYICGLAKKLSN